MERQTENPCVVAALLSGARERQTLFLASVPSRGEASVSLVGREGGAAGFNPKGPGRHKELEKKPSALGREERKSELEPKGRPVRGTPADTRQSHSHGGGRWP